MVDDILWMLHALFATENRESTAYARALVAFVHGGGTEQARSHLSRALATSLKSEVNCSANSRRRS